MNDYDCLLLYDPDNDVGDVRATVTAVHTFVDSHCLSVFVPQRLKSLPKQKIMNLTQNAIAETDVIIIVISEDLSTHFKNLLQTTAQTMKGRHPGIIPVFCNGMKPVDVKDFVEENMPFLNDVNKFLTYSPNYLKKVLEAIKTPGREYYFVYHITSINQSIKLL